MRILIVDDHALFREGLSHVLHELDAQVIILEASDYDRALQLAANHPDLDLVLLDLHMPGKGGFAILDIFAKQYPTMPVVILSGSNQRSDIQRALNGGAMGYIPKDTTSTVMLNALRLVFSGGIYVPPQLNHAGQDLVSKASLAGHGLTPRQIDVLALVVRGCSNKEIANKLDLAEATVKMHVTSIFKTLGVNNRTQAALAAEKLGLLLN